MLQCTGTDDDDPSTFHSSPKLFHDVISSSQCVTKKHPERWYPSRAGAERMQAGAVIVTPVRVGRHTQAPIPPLSLRWVVCTRPAHPPSLAAKAFSGLGPRLSHCIRAHILYFWPVRVSLRGRQRQGARRAGCWCGTPGLELVASRSAIDLLFRRGLLVSGKLGFVTMFFSLWCTFSVRSSLRSFVLVRFIPAD